VIGFTSDKGTNISITDNRLRETVQNNVLWLLTDRLLLAILHLQSFHFVAVGRRHEHFILLCTKAEEFLRHSGEFVDVTDVPQGYVNLLQFFISSEQRFR